jgi:hypothetical protein
LYTQSKTIQVLKENHPILKEEPKTSKQTNLKALRNKEGLLLSLAIRLQTECKTALFSKPPL